MVVDKDTISSTIQRPVFSREMVLSSAYNAFLEYAEEDLPVTMWIFESLRRRSSSLLNEMFSNDGFDGILEWDDFHDYQCIYSGLCSSLQMSGYETDLSVKETSMLYSEVV